MQLSMFMKFMSIVTHNSSYSQAFCRIVEDSLKNVAEYKKTIESGSVIPSFGQKADEVCNAAIERFAQEAALPEDSKAFENVYDKKVDDLEKVLDSPLHVVYLKQLSLLREKALKSFKSSIASAPDAGNDYEYISQVTIISSTIIHFYDRV